MMTSVLGREVFETVCRKNHVETILEPESPKARRAHPEVSRDPEAICGSCRFAHRRLFEPLEPEIDVLGYASRKVIGLTLPEQ